MSIRTAVVVTLAAVVTGSQLAAQTQVKDRKTLTPAGAGAVVAAGTAEAARLGAPGGAIAIVDDGGNLVRLQRLDNTFPAAADIAIGKARTAALFRRPTQALEDAIVAGRSTLLNVAEAPLQGGVPLVVDGVVVGAVGVSGAASAQQDTEIATAAAQGLGREASAASVTYLDHGRVRDAFERGVPLIETGAYKVHASRREALGQAEVHEADTDIVYVLEGTATFVTGGTVVGSKTTAVEEVRGSEILGGDTRRLAAGDVVIVPRGTPHWFKEVRGPFLYYVVKVREVAQ